LNYQVTLAAVVILLNSFTVWSAEIRTSNGLISIQAENEPFSRVMKDLGQALGCEVIMPASSKSVSIFRTNAKLRNMFRDLLNGYQYVVYWSYDPAGKGKVVDRILVLGVSPATEGISQSIFQPEELAVAEINSVDDRIESLINMTGTNEKQQSLRQALQDASPDVRLVALDILFSQGDAEAKQMIQSALGDMDPKIREAAREILADLDAVYPDQ